MRRWMTCFSVCLAKIIFANLFYYSAFFCYYSWAPLHFLILFMSLIILFQLTFTFIYSTFSKKFSLSAKSFHFQQNKRIPNRPLGFVWIQLIFAETENWKNHSKIIFKCVNSVVGPVNSTWTVRNNVFCLLHSKFMWCYYWRARGKKKGLKTQTWIWKHGSKPTLSPSERER